MDRRQLLSGSSPAKRKKSPRTHAVDWVPLDVADAERDGLLSIIERLRPGYAERVRRWRLLLNYTFEQRLKGDRPLRSRAWYLHELRHPKLLDLRAERTFDEDLRLVYQYSQLRHELRVIFRDSKSPKERSARGAESIRKILKVDVNPGDLLPLPTATQYCYHALNTDKVQLSRARGRLKRIIRANLPHDLDALEQLKSGSTDPALIRRVQIAAAFLTQEILPLLRRPK